MRLHPPVSEEEALAWLKQQAAAVVGDTPPADQDALADVLVQPGRAGPFNDYRLPSKLPEFLSAGRPVVLPATNLARQLRDVLLGERRQHLRVGSGRCGASLERLGNARHFAELHRALDRRMRCEDLLQQGRARARHADDEDRGRHVRRECRDEDIECLWSTGR